MKKIFVTSATVTGLLLLVFVQQSNAQQQAPERAKQAARDVKATREIKVVPTERYAEAEVFFG